MEELAYDPKASQTTNYVRAKVTLNVENLAFEVKNLILPSGEITVITYSIKRFINGASLALDLLMRNLGAHTPRESNQLQV